MQLPNGQGLDGPGGPQSDGDQENCHSSNAVASLVDLTACAREVLEMGNGSIEVARARARQVLA
eukprot:802795-Pyramimonas_sp.AAC.1